MSLGSWQGEMSNVEADENTASGFLSTSGHEQTHTAATSAPMHSSSMPAHELSRHASEELEAGSGLISWASSIMTFEKDYKAAVTCLLNEPTDDIDEQVTQGGETPAHVERAWLRAVEIVLTQGGQDKDRKSVV